MQAKIIISQHWIIWTVNIMEGKESDPDAPAINYLWDNI